MFLRNLLFLLPIFSLVIFSSCGIIKIDTSVAVEQFTNFSGESFVENTMDDCGCVEEPKYIRPPCPMIYIPVCGCNDSTYTNPCEAQRAGVTIFKKGECPPNYMNPTPYKRQFYF